MYILLILNLICPLVMLLVAYMLKKNPVKDMNSNNGYNTPISRKSIAHFEYGQIIAPDIFINIGKISFIIEILISVVMFILKIDIAVCISIGNVIGFVILGLAFVVTDNKIKNHFDE